MMLVFDLLFLSFSFALLQGGPQKFHPNSTKILRCQMEILLPISDRELKLQISGSVTDTFLKISSVIIPAVSGTG